MIQYNPKKWFDLIFHSYSRQVVRMLLPTVLFMTVYSGLISYLVIDYLEIHFRSTTAVHSLLGIVLGLFLVFRTNSAYDRWWEGRKQWGNMVNATRNLSVKLGAFMPEDRQEDREFFARMIPNFVASFRDHLRQTLNKEDLNLKPEEEEMLKRKHVPTQFVLAIQKRVNRLYREDVFTGEQLLVLDLELKRFLNILGACERIKNTPIPYAYSMYIKKFIFVYVLTLPLGLVTQFEYWTLPVVLFIFTSLFTIELIAEEIEDPFGKDINDLPTDGLTETITGNVQEILLESNLSPVLED